MIPARVKGSLLLAVTFAAGVAAGIGVERRLASLHAAIAGDAHDSMHRLAADLHLDSDQQRAVNDILVRHQKEVDAAWHTVQPHVLATMESVHQEIERLLRPDQAAAFRKMIDARHPDGHR